MVIFRGTFSANKTSGPGMLAASSALLAIPLLIFVLLFTDLAVVTGDYLHSQPDSRYIQIAALSCAGVYHVVRPGQTIYSIAALYGSTAYRIKICNGLRSYRVYVGQGLLVPTRYSSFGGG